MVKNIPNIKPVLEFADRRFKVIGEIGKKGI
jgi:hypothetical protein